MVGPLNTRSPKGVALEKGQFRRSGLHDAAAAPDAASHTPARRTGAAAAVPAQVGCQGAPLLRSASAGGGSSSISKASGKGA
jgi:hypothetical protein